MNVKTLISLFVIAQFTIVLLEGIAFNDGFQLNPYNAEGEQDASIMWLFLLDPTGWSGNSWINLLVSIGLTTGGITLGLYAFTKSDSIFFLPYFVALISLGNIFINTLFNYANKNLAVLTCGTENPCGVSIILTTLSVGFLAFYFVMTTFESWSGRRT
jgi:hypothetical protein